jgi:hypothetical protein
MRCSRTTAQRARNAHTPIRRATPNLEDVLAAIVRGRVARLRLDDAQKHALRDRDGQLALDVVRHLLGARHASVHPGEPPAPFPLTEHCFAAVARALGRPAGIKRSRVLLRRLLAEGVLERAGLYRQAYRDAAGASGYRVPLYRLAAGAWGIARRLCGPPGLKRAVGRRAPVKRVPKRRWWQHELFGTPDGRPPPQLTRRQRRMWKSPDERMGTWR